MSDCLFCNIISGDIPSTKVYEDELCYGFKDISPLAPVHILVIPKLHLSSVSEISEDNCSIIGHIFSVIPKIAQQQGIEEYRVVSNCGESAGQSVFHLHFHVLGGKTLDQFN